MPEAEDDVQEEAEIPIDERPLLVIDDREPKDRIAEVGRRRVYRTEVRRLEVADILLGDVAFEFKLVADFYGSIMDGRIFQQARELDLNYPGKAYIVVCGSLQELRYSRPQWRYNAKLWASIEASFRGALWSLYERTDIRVMEVANLKEFTERLAAKAKRLQRGEKVSERPMITLKGSDRTPVQEAEDVLCAISGIGRTAARGLLGHFGSIEKVMAADVKALSQAPEIGKVRAEHLHVVLHAVHVVPPA